MKIALDFEGLKSNQRTIERSLTWHEKDAGIHAEGSVWHAKNELGFRNLEKDEYKQT